MRRLRCHELIGRRVVDRDGKCIDHLVDFVATPVGDRLTISALLVGPRAFVARVAQRRWLLGDLAPIEIPWSEVIEVGDTVRVAVSRDSARGRRASRQPGAGR